MRIRSIKLYSFTALVFMLPLMDFGFDQIIPYLKGPEGRALLAELLTQVISGVVNVAIVVGIDRVFGT